MKSPDLKAKFGDKISFHGGIDIQQVLPFGTKDEIEEEVRMRINALGHDGGYILAPAHNVQADVKPENIIFMIEAAKKFGRYPLYV